METVKESSALRFTPSLDIILFKEVVAQNPFNCDDPNEAWDKVADACTRAFNKKVMARSARERCLRQLSYFVTEDNKNLKRSGTDEEFGEKQELLQEIKSLKETGEEMKKDKTKKVEKRRLLTTPGGSDIRLAAMRGLNATGDHEETSEGFKKQRISSSHKQLAIIEILEKKQQAEERFKEKQLQLEERRLALEERKMALEEQKMELMRQGRTGKPEF